MLLLKCLLLDSQVHTPHTLIFTSIFFNSRPLENFPILSRFKLLLSGLYQEDCFSLQASQRISSQQYKHCRDSMTTPSKQRILIPGGAGYIGSHVVLCVLLTRRYKVTGELTSSVVLSF